MSDLDVETSKNPRDFLGESFGIGQNNHTALVRITHFLLSVSLATIIDEIGRVIISGKGFCYSVSFSCSFLLRVLWYFPNWPMVGFDHLGPWAHFLKIRKYLSDRECRLQKKNPLLLMNWSFNMFSR